MSGDDGKPWRRGPDELPRAYAGFRAYRDLGATRQYEPVSEAMGVSLKTVKRWAQRWNWRERAIAWDDETNNATDDARLKAVREMYEQHRKVGRAAVAKALKVLNDAEDRHISPGTAVRLLDFGTRIERLVLSTTPEEFVGVAPDGAPIEDPWDAIAEALTAG